jgi:DNA (cytosine-5)-methyltransferase 1
MTFQTEKLRYAEFFAGGGMVTAGLGNAWQCVLANDIDAAKCDAYRKNWGSDHLVQGDIAALPPSVLRQPVDLYWASSPCQDFSLAGKGQGLAGSRSGTFRSWMDQVSRAVSSGFGPKLIAFENVTGLVSRRSGADFTEVLNAFIDLGYRVGALQINAELFLPQSRPRIFVIAIRADASAAFHTGSTQAESPFHSKLLRQFLLKADEKIRQNWIWWNVPAPTGLRSLLGDIIDTGASETWMSRAHLETLLALMSDLNRQKVVNARRTPGLHVGTIYKRGRPDELGVVRQRAEVRFDGLAGCLRTPAGGSSRQTILVVADGEVRARLLNTREAARLMGLSDTYNLPKNYNEAYKIAGDGVAVPVVRHLAKCIFEPVLRGFEQDRAA